MNDSGQNRLGAPVVIVKSLKAPGELSEEN
jgi:hypothetical protein